MYASAKKNLLNHYFWGNIDTGVLHIFMGLYLWSFDKNPISIAIAFAIPVVVNIMGDYVFSVMSDKKGRRRYMIVGNIGSALFLSSLGLSDNITYIYVFIFMKSVFSKLYQTSLEPYERLVMKGELQEFIAKKTVKISAGASIGGFLLMTLLGMGFTMERLIIICGVFELASTFYLLSLPDTDNREFKDIEGNNTESLKFFGIYYGIYALALAIFDTRLLLYFINDRNMDPSIIGLIFFIVYGLPNIFSGRIYKYFRNMDLKRMLLSSTLLQAGLLLLIPFLDSINLLISLWFIISVFESVTHIYSNHHYKSGIYSDIGKNMSKIRIISTVGLLIGQGLISLVWKEVSLESTFYLSAFLLSMNIVYVIRNGKKVEGKESSSKESVEINI